MRQPRALQTERERERKEEEKERTKQKLHSNKQKREKIKIEKGKLVVTEGTMTEDPQSYVHVCSSDPNDVLATV